MKPGAVHPDVSARVAEACSADAPGSVHRPVEQFDAAFAQSLAHQVDVLDCERELETGAGRDRG